MTVAVHWTGSQIVANSRLTPQPAVTTGRLCSESLESVLSVPTTNTPQQKSHRVHKLSQLVSGLYLFSVLHSILCVLVSYLVEKQNCSERSVGAGIIAGLRAGRSALQ